MSEKGRFSFRIPTNKHRRNYTEKYYFAAIISIINSGNTHSWSLKLFSYISLINEKEKNANFTVEKPDRYHLT